MVSSLGFLILGILGIIVPGFIIYSVVSIVLYLYYGLETGGYHEGVTDDYGYEHMRRYGRAIFLFCL